MSTTETAKSDGTGDDHDKRVTKARDVESRCTYTVCSSTSRAERKGRTRIVQLKQDREISEKENKEDEIRKLGIKYQRRRSDASLNENDDESGDGLSWA